MVHKSLVQAYQELVQYCASYAKTTFRDVLVNSPCTVMGLVFPSHLLVLLCRVMRKRAVIVSSAGTPILIHIFVGLVLN